MNVEDRGRRGFSNFARIQRESLALAVLLPKYTSFPIERARYPHTTWYYDLSTTIVSRRDRRTLLSWIDYRPSLESLHNFTPSPKRYTYRHAQSRFQGDCLVIRIRWSDAIRTSGPEVILLSVWRFRIGHTGEIGPATTAEVSDPQRLRHATSISSYTSSPTGLYNPVSSSKNLTHEGYR